MVSSSSSSVVSAVSEITPVLNQGPKPENAGQVTSMIRWPPAVAARFQLPRFLGKGIFGRVYAAWDTVTEQLVAVKQFSDRTHGDLVAKIEFAQEVSALEACRGHSNVVQLVDTIEADGGDLFIVTEYAGRWNLRQYMQKRLKEGQPFSEAEVRDAMRQITAGVACAHRANFVHREIVPEHVVVYDEKLEEPMMEEKRRKKACVKYKICGFNASKRVGGVDGPLLWVYHAPELFLNPENDDLIDTWGLGCIMAELLADKGKQFYGKSVIEAIWSLHVVVGDKCMNPLRQKFPDEVLSQAGFDVLSGLLAKDMRLRLKAEDTLKMPWFVVHRRRGIFGCFTSPVTHDSN